MRCNHCAEAFDALLLFDPSLVSTRPGLRLGAINMTVYRILVIGMTHVRQKEVLVAVEL